MTCPVVMATPARSRAVGPLLWPVVVVALLTVHMCNVFDMCTVFSMGVYSLYILITWAFSFLNCLSAHLISRNEKYVYSTICIPL